MSCVAHLSCVAGLEAKFKKSHEFGAASPVMDRDGLKAKGLYHESLTPPRYISLVFSADV